ncbi:MAG: hypothetical protein J2O46_08985 [Nocardioides sp.]|nr:hypothetical protein [Nocardioides sp.]
MTPAVRAALDERQREVLDALLSGGTPAGFSAVGTALTTRVLLGKRADGVAHVAPEIAHLSGWRDLFRTWAAEHPKEGCAHDDLRGFVASLGAHPWVRLHEVYDGRRHVAWTRLGSSPALVIGIRGTVWTFQARRRNPRPGPKRLTLHDPTPPDLRSAQ